MLYSDSSAEATGQVMHSVKQVNEDGEWAQKYRMEGFPGGSIFYQPQLIEEATANRWYEALCNLDAWCSPTVSLHGKPHVPSRFIACYTMSASLAAKYTAPTLKMNHPCPPLLQEIRRIVSEKLGIQFNHILMNWYPDGWTNIGKHRDGKCQVIACLSLGAPRKFRMSPHFDKGEKKLEGAEVWQWVLENGSLLVMQGDTQENWKHEILKEPEVEEGRISLTFGQLVQGH